MTKIWKYDKTFEKKIKKLEIKNKYSFDYFKIDVVDFLKDELNPKFRKHKLNGFKEDVFSITLGYDLRALYFLVNKKSRGEVEYIFFDIGTHDEIY